MIIKAEKKHLQIIAELLVQEWYDSIEEAKEQVILKINNNECYIKLINEEIVGLFMYSRDYSHYANYLEDLLVAKKYRRKGIALELLKKYIEISKRETPKKQKWALSSTDKNNLASIKTHIKAGFEEIGIINGLHYGTDEIMFGFNLNNYST